MLLLLLGWLNNHHPIIISVAVREGNDTLRGPSEFRIVLLVIVASCFFMYRWRMSSMDKKGGCGGGECDDDECDCCCCCGDAV